MKSKAYTFLLKKTLLYTWLLVTVNTQAQIDTAWTSTFGDVYWEELHGITTDANGNAYVAGWTRYSANERDWAIAKYNPSGTQEWFKTYTYPGGGTFDYTELITTDKNGNIYAAGIAALSYVRLARYDAAGDTIWEALNTTYFGAVANALTVDNHGNIIIAGYLGLPGYGLILKYDSSGAEQWSHVFNLLNVSYSRYLDVITDSLDFIYVTGRAQFDTTSNDVLTVKYTPLGDTVWARRWNNNVYNYVDEGFKVRTDENGHIFIGGMTAATNPGNDNFLIMKYDTSGNLIWNRAFDGTGNKFDHITAMVTGSSGSVIVTGETGVTFNNADFLTIKYDTNGDTVWTKYYGGPNNDYPSAMLSDDFGNIYITGFGINAGGSGGWNGVTIKYDSSGVEKWTVAFDGNHNNGEDEFYGIAIDQNRDILVTGRSQGDTTSYDFLTIKYLNSTSGVEIIESGDPDLYLSCFPNPFSDHVFISYYLPRDSGASVYIYDITGKEVSVIKFRNQLRGNHVILYNATGMADGIYFGRLISAGRTAVIKILVQH